MAGSGHFHTDNGAVPVQHNSDTSPETVYFDNMMARTSIDESRSTSRSSSKASSIDTTGNKPPKPRRPTNYSERKSSISKRPNLSAQITALSLSPLVLNSMPTTVPSPPISAGQSSHRSLSPKSTFTPIIERQHSNAPEHHRALSPIEDESNEESDSEFHFPLPTPKRLKVDVPVSSANQMYWHQPSTHGMMRTGPARRSHSIAQIGSQFYIFGGSDGKALKATDTIFIFDADTQFWRIPTVTGTLPPPLRAQTTTAYRQNIYLFGGGTGNNECYNHVYVFSTQTYRWTCLIKSNRHDARLPTPRRAHTSVQFDRAMYVFGGGSGTSGLNDLWRLDLVTNEWKKLRPVGKKPEPRVYHTATVVRDVMIIYGGLDGRQCFSNLYLYNFSANTFTELTVSGPRLCRISHTTTCVGSQLFVFGGSNGSVFNNEVWVFDLTSRTWSMRPCSGLSPMARGYHTSVFYDARLWVFGGMDTVWEGFTDVNVLEFGASGYLGSVYVDHAYVR